MLENKLFAFPLILSKPMWRSSCTCGIKKVLAKQTSVSLHFVIQMAGN